MLILVLQTLLLALVVTLPIRREYKSNTGHLIALSLYSTCPSVMDTGSTQTSWLRGIRRTSKMSIFCLKRHRLRKVAWHPAFGGFLYFLFFPVHPFCIIK
jgi:hypothetical protein